MKKILFVIYITIMLKVSAKGQESDTIHLTNYKPLKCGYVKRNNDTPTSLNINPSKGIQIFTCDSNTDSVYAISKGKVLAVERIEDEYVCVIQSSQMTITYGTLSSSALEKGMNIKTGDYLGRIYETFPKKLLRIVIRIENKVLNYNNHLSDLIN